MQSAYRWAIKVVLPVMALLLATSAGAADYSAQELERNIRITVDSCAKKKRHDPANHFFSDSLLNIQCECYATKLYSLTTKREIEYSNKNKTIENLKDKPRIAEEYCNSKLVGLWSVPSEDNKLGFIALYKTKNYSVCYRGLTSKDAVMSRENATRVCQCFVSELAGRLSVTQLADSENRPDIFSTTAEKAMSDCIDNTFNK